MIYPANNTFFVLLFWNTQRARALTHTYTYYTHARKECKEGRYIEEALFCFSSIPEGGWGGGVEGNDDRFSIGGRGHNLLKR